MQCMCTDHVMLTCLWCPDHDHLIGFMQFAETLNEHLYLIGGVWFQHSQFVAGFVAVSIQIGPLLCSHNSVYKGVNVDTADFYTLNHSQMQVGVIF